MKKSVSIILILSLVLSLLAACTPQEPEPVVPEPEPEPEPVYVYQDGTYEAQFTIPAQDGNMESLTVQIVNDVIEIKGYSYKSEPASSEADTAQSAVSSDASSDQDSQPQETQAEFTHSITKAFEEADKDITKLKPIEGQEEHTYRFIRMMSDILENAKTGNTQPISFSTRYADGDYLACMPDFNPQGWRAYVKLSVTNDEFVSIEYNAVSEKDETQLITLDAELNAEGVAAAPATYYPAIVDSFKNAGYSLDGIVTPTGGAPATKAFKKLMGPLFASMMSGGEKDIIVNQYVDGEYRAQFKDFDENGWKEYIVIQVEDGAVTIKQFDAFHQEDENRFKSQDADLETKMTEKTGTNPKQYTKDLIDSWGKADGDVTKVDNITGATVSSNSFKLLLGELLATAATAGDTDSILEVERVQVEAPSSSSSSSSADGSTSSLAQ